MAIREDHKMQLVHFDLGFKGQKEQNTKILYEQTCLRHDDT